MLSEERSKEIHGHLELGFLCCPLGWLAEHTGAGEVELEALDVKAEGRTALRHYPK